VEQEVRIPRAAAATVTAGSPATRFVFKKSPLRWPQSAAADGAITGVVGDRRPCVCDGRHRKIVTRVR
jgi:hypothetical protein